METIDKKRKYLMMKTRTWKFPKQIKECIKTIFSAMEPRRDKILLSRNMVERKSGI